jgi:hypothetical protein
MVSNLIKKGGGMILLLLKGKGMVSGLFEKKRDDIPPHPAPPQALAVCIYFSPLLLIFFILLIN